MNEFMKMLLSLSASGTLLLLLILALKPLYKNKFSRCWQYYIWMIVVLRFLLPFTPDTTLVGSLFGQFDTAAIMSGFPANLNIPISVNTSNIEYGSLQTDKGVKDADTTHRKWMPEGADSYPIQNSGTFCDAVQKTADEYTRGNTLFTYLFLIWMAPAMVLFIRKITIYQSFIRQMKAGNTEVSDLKILNLLSEWEEKLDIRERVELSCNPQIASPMLIGIFRPGIILPVRELEEKEYTYIFMHELVHCKQRDMFYKWLIQMVVCIHWFNPFVYLLEKEVNKACELSCDEKAISMLGEQARREYGDTLLSFVKLDRSRRSSLASVTLTEGAQQLKERLGAIMNFRKRTRYVTIVSFAAAFLLAVSGFAMGAYAAWPSSRENGADFTRDSAAGEGGNEIWESDSGRGESGWIIHESAHIDFYEDGSPYLRDVLTNRTVRRIIETEYCILAYDDKGSPLKLHWNFLDSSAEDSYENLVRKKADILPGQTQNDRGGWSLYNGEETEYMPKREDGESAQVAYALFCLKQVVFEDGTVWNNPGYEDWFQAYAGKETGLAELQNYYPFEYEIGVE